jgi:hypothetical protein
MKRIGRWLPANAEPTLALAIAIVFGALGVLDVLGPDSSIVNAAVLLTLALLAATLLRDRASVDQALNAMSAVGPPAAPSLARPTLRRAATQTAGSSRAAPAIAAREHAAPLRGDRPAGGQAAARAAGGP